MYERIFECFINLRLRKDQCDDWEVVFTAVVEDLEGQPFRVFYLTEIGGEPGTTCLAVTFDAIC